MLVPWYGALVLCYNCGICVSGFQVVIGGGRDGKFEAKFFHKVS